MILVILAIGIILTVGGVLLYYYGPDAGNYDSASEIIGGILVDVGGFVTVIALVFTACLGVTVSKLNVIDDKIAMYQEENAKIEEQIAAVVQGYQDYESDIIKSVSPESAVTLVSLYPELKSDALVQSQIEVYTANNEKIKELKEKQISGSVHRWWLYFGG